MKASAENSEEQNAGINESRTTLKRKRNKFHRLVRAGEALGIEGPIYHVDLLDPTQTTLVVGYAPGWRPGRIGGESVRSGGGGGDSDDDDDAPPAKRVKKPKKKKYKKSKTSGRRAEEHSE